MLTGVAISLALLAMLAGVLGRAGIEVDGGRRAWRNYYKFLGISMGRWQRLPSIAGVTIKYFSSKSSPTPGTLGSLASWNGSSQRHEQLVILLSVTGSAQGIVLRTVQLAELQQARVFAQETALELGVPIREFLPSHK